MHLSLIRQQLELILQRNHTLSSVYLIRGLSFLKHIWTDPLCYDTTYTVITAFYCGNSHVDARQQDKPVENFSTARSDYLDDQINIMILIVILPSESSASVIMPALENELNLDLPNQ